MDYQVVNSDITADRDHLRVGDHFVRLLTMREAFNVTRPLVLDRLLKIEANFYAVTEWTPLATDAAKKEVVKRRRHANVSKSGFISSIKDESKVNQRDVLIDEGKQADIEALGDCLRALADGQLLGDMSLTIVLYDRDRATVEHEVPDFAGIPCALIPPGTGPARRLRGRSQVPPPAPSPIQPNCVYMSNLARHTERKLLFAAIGLQ